MIETITAKMGSLISGMIGGAGSDLFKEQIKQRMPGFLGLSLEDERLFSDLRVRLRAKTDVNGKSGADIDDALSRFLNYLSSFERNRFRNVVAGMLNVKRTEKIESEAGKDQNGKKAKPKTSTTVTAETDCNNAIDVLKTIGLMVLKAEERNDKEPYKTAKDWCLSGGVVFDSSIVKKAIDEWAEAVKWWEENSQRITNEIIRDAGLLNPPNDLKEQIGRLLGMVDQKILDNPDKLSTEEWKQLLPKTTLSKEEEDAIVLVLDQKEKETPGVMLSVEGVLENHNYNLSENSMMDLREKFAEAIKKRNPTLIKVIAAVVIVQMGSLETKMKERHEKLESRPKWLKFLW